MKIKNHDKQTKQKRISDYNLRSFHQIYPGCQINNNNSICSTEKYLFYSTSHQIFVIELQTQQIKKVIHLNNTVVIGICIQKNQLAIACRDKKIRIYNTDNLQINREVILARQDNLLAMQFHPQIEDCILILYDSNQINDQQSEIKSLNVVTGVSQIIIVDIQNPLNLICSPFSQEIITTSRDGILNIYGLDQQGQIIYQRLVPYDQINHYEQKDIIKKCDDSFTQLFYQYQGKKLYNTKSNKVYVCYDPFNNNTILIAWQSGQIILMNTKNGQIITIYEPIQDNIIDICFNTQQPGQFYVITKQSKQILSYNISQRLPQIKRQYQYNFIKMVYINSDVIQNACAFISDTGNVFIYYRDELININKCINISLAKSALIQNNILYVGNQNGNINCIDISKLNVNQNQIFDIEQQLMNNSQFEHIKHKQSGIIGIINYDEQYMLIGFGQGDICLVKKQTGQIISVIVNAIQINDYSNYYKQLDQIAEQYNFQADTNLYLQKEKLISIILHNNLLFTSWRDGNIRIFYINENKECKYISNINLLKLSGNDEIEQFLPMDIKIIDQLLFICCTCGQLFCIDINQFQQDFNTKYINQLSKQQIINELKSYFMRNCQYGIFDLCMIEFDNQNIKGLAKSQIKLINQRLILRQIAIKKISENEQQYLQEQFNIKFQYLLLISTNMQVVRLFGFNAENNNVNDNKIYQIRQFNPLEKVKIDGSDILGMKSVLFTQNDFEFLCSGLSGQTFVIQWNIDKNNQIVYKTVQQKVDTCYQILHNNILISFQFDGSIQFYNLKEYEEYEEYKKQVQQNTILKNFYIQLKANDLDSTNMHLKYNQYNQYSIYLRIKSICFVLIQETQQYYRFDFNEIIQIIYKELNQIYQQESVQQLYQLIKSNIDQKYSVLNLECEYNINKSYQAYNKLNYLIKLLIISNFNDIITKLFYQIGLIAQSLSIAQLSSQETKKEIMSKSYQLQKDELQQKQDIVKRFQLDGLYSKQYNLLARFIESIKKNKDKKEQIIQLFQKIVSFYNQTIAYIVYIILQEKNILPKDIEELNEYIKEQIIQYNLQQRNLTISFEMLIQNMQDNQISNLLFVMNDYNMCQYIQDQLEDKGLDKYKLLPQIIKCNQQLTCGKLNLEYINSLQQYDQQQLDQLSMILTGGLDIQQYLNILQLTFDYQWYELENNKYQMPDVNNLQDNQVFYKLIYDFLTHKLNQEQIFQYFVNVDISLDQLEKIADKILLLFKLSVLPIYQYESSVISYPFLNLILISGQILTCKLGQRETYEIIQTQAERAVRKLKYKQLIAQKELQESSFESIRQRFQYDKQYQYYGRQLFETYENDLFQILFGFNRLLQWN